MKKIQNCWFFSQLCKYKDYLALIFLNIFTNYLFIGYFKFVSDDWPQLVYSDIAIYPLSHLFLESQRTGQFVLTKIFFDTLGESAFGYHLVNLITTTVLLILVYLILKELLKILFLNPTRLAFMGAVFFCILFNKDELYSWAALFYDNIAFALYLASFYLFIQSAKRWYYFYVSWLLFAIAIFIYEIGVLLPVAYIFYALIEQKNCRNVSFFIIPPIAYMLIRLTNWFGYGWMYINRYQNYFSLNFLSTFIDTCIHNVIASIGITTINLFYAVLGLLKLNVIFLCILLILDLIVAGIIVSYFICPLTNSVSKNYERKFIQIILFCLIGLAFSYITISAHGIVRPRYLLFIDFFVILLLIILINPLIKTQKHAVILIAIITMCLLINQGLYTNWVISGEIQDSVNKAIFSHASDISKGDYFFVNSSDLFRNNPNYVFNIGSKFSLIVNQNSNQVYYPYLNAEGLAGWSVGAMMRGAQINQTSTTLIYGDEGNVFVSSENGKITYKNSITGNYYTIKQSEYYEGNSSNLLVTYENQRKSNWIFNE
jgi:hypothetical protein